MAQSGLGHQNGVLGVPGSNPGAPTNLNIAIFSDGGTERRKERDVALAPAFPCGGDHKEIP